MGRSRPRFLELSEAGKYVVVVGDIIVLEGSLKYLMRRQ